MCFAYTGQEHVFWGCSCLSSSDVLKHCPILHKQLRCCHERRRSREAEGNSYPTSIALSWPFLGKMDKGYDQGDASPKKLSGHHLYTGSLPPLDWTEAFQGWVGRHYWLCLLPSSQSWKEPISIIFLTGTWVSHVTTPSTLGSAYLYHEISTIITLFCVQSNYFYFNLHYSNFCTDLVSSNESGLTGCIQSKLLQWPPRSKWLGIINMNSSILTAVNSCCHSCPVI